MSTQGNPSRLISGHATDTLSPAERRELYRAALDDQEIFDRLVEEEPWRQIFDSPGVKADLLEALDEPTGGGWLAWLRPATVPRLAMGAGLAAVLAVALVPRLLGPGAGDPAAPGSSTSDLVAKSYDPEADPAISRTLRPKSTGAAVRELSYTLEVNRPDGPREVPSTWSFLPGEQFRLRLGADFSAWLYLFNRASGDAAYSVLYPRTATEIGPLPASQREVVFPAGSWLTMDDSPEDEELVLVVSDRPWAPAAGRDTLPAAELQAALKQAEERFSALNWRRSEVDERVRLAVEEGDDALVIVVRMLEGS